MMFFSIEGIKFEVNGLTNRKYKDVEGYQDEILQTGGPIMIPCIHKLFNLVVNEGFLKPKLKASLYLCLKLGIKEISLIIGPL
jgi:hypothetical protein